MDVNAFDIGKYEPDFHNEVKQVILANELGEHLKSDGRYIAAVQLPGENTIDEGSFLWLKGNAVCTIWRASSLHCCRYTNLVAENPDFQDQAESALSHEFRKLTSHGQRRAHAWPSVHKDT